MPPRMPTLRRDPSTGQFLHRRGHCWMPVIQALRHQEAQSEGRAAVAMLQEALGPLHKASAPSPKGGAS